MPETETIVINTGPLLALIAGYGDLSLLKNLYRRILVPFEVCREIEAGGALGFGVNEFNKSDFLDKISLPLSIPTYLKNSLDLGESSVIQLALQQNIATVCIDETVGRRIARLNGLKLTGSIGVLIRARQAGLGFSMSEVIDRMQARGIYLSQKVMRFALLQCHELDIKKRS
jgi:predicted nucleic acid-binding protein